MAYVHQSGKIWHYTWPYSGITLCDQKVDEWPNKYFSKVLRDGEQLCSVCAGHLVCQPVSSTCQEPFKLKRATVFKTTRKPAYNQIKDVLRTPHN